MLVSWVGPGLGFTNRIQTLDLTWQRNRWVFSKLVIMFILNDTWGNNCITAYWAGFSNAIAGFHRSAWNGSLELSLFRTVSESFDGSFFSPISFLPPLCLSVIKSKALKNNVDFYGYKNFWNRFSWSREYPLINSLWY